MTKFNIIRCLYILLLFFASACAEITTNPNQATGTPLITETPTEVAQNTTPTFTYSSHYKGLTDIFHCLDDSEELILCFHGSGGDAVGWSQKGDDKIDFSTDLAEQSWSFICPSSKDRVSKQWSPTYSELNSDVQNLDTHLEEFGIPVGISIIFNWTI